MTTITPTAADIVQQVPRLVKASLVQCIRTAYSVADQIALDFPIIGGPLEATILGQLRYVLVNNVVAMGVQDGLVPGNADWCQIANASGHFLEYSYDDFRITFASAQGLYKFPKKSNFRLSRANENQLSLFPLDSPEFGDESPALLMLHGYQSLNFTQLMMPGDCDGHMIALAWSGNLLDLAQDNGLSGTPVNPIPTEPLAEIALRLRTEEIDKLRNHGNP